MLCYYYKKIIKIKMEKLDLIQRIEECKYYNNNGNYCGYIREREDLSMINCKYITKEGFCNYEVPKVKLYLEK